MGSDAKIGQTVKPSSGRTKKFFLPCKEKTVQMPQYRVKYVFLVICCTLLFSNCVNLNHVTRFSTAAIESVESFETLSPSFYKTCLADCQHKHIVTLNIHQTDCDCSQNQEADRITELMYQSLQAYFYALTSISDNQLTNYQTAGLTNAVTSGNFGSIQVNEAEAKSYSNIITLVGRAFTDGYRRNKIKTYISNANQPVQDLLHFLDLNLAGNLKGKLEVQKSSIKNFYFDLVRDTQLSTYERTKFAEDYFSRIQEIERQQRELEEYSKILNSIAEGHTKLYAAVEQLHNDELKVALAKYGSQLKMLSTSLFKN